MESASDTQFSVLEKVPVTIFETSFDASVCAAKEIAQLIRSRAAEGKICVLGLATGSSPIKVYGELVRLHKEEGLSFKNVMTFNLDEYYPMPKSSIQSYYRFMHEYLFDHIDIPKENINIPSGTIPEEEVEAYCREYEEKILKAGGIDIQLLGIGRTGHIGFNEPGSSKKSATRMVHLDRLTRVDAASDFFALENVPKRAITMGVGTILAAKKIILLAFSEGKGKIVQKAVEGPVTSEVAASFLQEHPNARFYIDRAASEYLTRIAAPWTIKGVPTDGLTFSPYEMKKAVVWLSLKVNKPILRLVEEDYEENGLAQLIRQEGNVGKVNITVYSLLQKTITGWPAGGRPATREKYDYRLAKAETKKKIVIFSPHPDDDVICMGGTMIKLTNQGHEVHVAYQTSGNIAVFDHDAKRFADFVSEYMAALNLPGFKDQEELRKKVEESFIGKKSGDVDIPEVQTIKGLIRKTEARSAALACGLLRENIHFLNLPFYQTGKVQKNPLGEEDVKITLDFLESIKPDQIYAAGDLSDPHGTHRVCFSAITKAIDILEKNKSEWFEKCMCYLYRGSWQEWEIQKIDMAVPMSPDELYEKRLAIYKHQSQKDPAVFPGADSREFWQRSEHRNRETAKKYDALGLAEYEALEVFVDLKNLRKMIQI